jgi:hypothetical protein
VKCCKVIEAEVCVYYPVKTDAFFEIKIVVFDSVTLVWKLLLSFNVLLV